MLNNIAFILINKIVKILIQRIYLLKYKSHFYFGIISGKPEALKNGENSVIVRLTKGQHMPHIVGKQIFPRQITLLDHTPMAAMKKYFSARKFDEIVPESECLSPEFRAKYKHLSQMIAKETPTVVVRIYEDKASMNIVTIMNDPLPKTIEKFFDDLDQEEMEKKKTNSDEKLAFEGHCLMLYIKNFEGVNLTEVEKRLLRES